jgi:hypothetical protein
MSSQAQSHYTIIDTQCDAQEAYKFNPGKHKIVGHLQALSFTGANKTLAQDTPLSDPTNPTTKTNVTGVIDYIKWEGGETDPIYLSFRVSPANRGDILEAVSSKGGGAELSVQFSVYAFDHTQKVYYSWVNTDGQDVTGKIALNTKVEIAAQPNVDIEQPSNYSITLVMSPKSDGADQSLNVATSVSQKTVHQFGILVS